MKEKNNQKTIIWILSGIIVLLALFIAYFFILNPTIEKFATKNKIEGYNFAVSNILNSVNMNGFVEIPISENQSVILVQYLDN